MKDRKYDIGDYVMVTQRVRRDTTLDNRREWKPSYPYSKPRLAQIVGVAYKQDGRIEGGYSYYPEDYCDRCLIVTKVHKFWIVRFTLRGKEQYVREEDMRLATIEETYELPYQETGGPLPDSVRKYLSEDSKDWPRDSKGRWVKG